MKTIFSTLICLVALACGTPARAFNLGPAGDYAILGIGGTIHLSSGPLLIYGNVGAGDHSNFQADGGGTVNGRLDYALTATVNTGNDTFTGGIHLIDFAAINQAVQNLVTFANGLTPTQTFTSITSPTTITGNGGQNVIAVTGSTGIHLSGGNLVLNGTASDTFIFQINQGNFALSGDTHIVLTGGLTPNNVLWDFEGSGGQVQTSGNSFTQGIFLAPNEGIQINGGIHYSEFISGVSMSFQSNPVINQIPEPSTLALLVSTGLILVGLRKRLIR
jgi:hypothetical protein